jgi:hypothetical protein
MIAIINHSSTMISSVSITCWHNLFRWCSFHLFTFFLEKINHFKKLSSSWWVTCLLDLFGEIHYPPRLKGWVSGAGMRGRPSSWNLGFLRRGGHPNVAGKVGNQVLGVPRVQDPDSRYNRKTKNKFNSNGDSILNSLSKQYVAFY